MNATMEVEIRRAYIKDKIMVIEAIDCSSINLMNIERNRIDDGMEKEVIFQFNTLNQYGFLGARKFLKSQKATAECRTYGEALSKIEGTVTSIPIRYRVRNWE